MINDKKKYSDRIYVLRRLCTNDLNHKVDEVLFDGLLDKFYNEFIDFCEYVKVNDTIIDDVSCYIEGDEINFDISYK